MDKNIKAPPNFGIELTVVGRFGKKKRAPLRIRLFGKRKKQGIECTVEQHQQIVFLVTVGSWVGGVTGDSVGFKVPVTVGENVGASVCPTKQNVCIALNSVVLPSQLEFIESGAFEECRNLSMVVCCRNIKRIDRNAFKSCGKILFFHPLSCNIHHDAGIAFTCEFRKVHLCLISTSIVS